MRIGLGFAGGVSPNARGEASLFAPFNLTPPSISGGAVVNSPLTCHPGVWAGQPTPVVTFQWLRDDVAITPSGTGSVYIPQAIDVGTNISCTVTASNTEGSAELTTEAVGPIESNNIAPINVNVPQIAGTAVFGSLLTVIPGTWSGNPVPVLSYQWLRDGVDIPDETDTTITLGGSDVGFQISVREIATNVAGTASVESARTAVVADPDPPFPPFVTVAPAVSGTATIGSVLTATNGTWSADPAPTFAKQWLADGYDIFGQTGNTYTILESDRFKRISVRVTATNSAGVNSGLSNTTVLVTGPETITKRYIRRFGTGLGNGTSWDNAGSLSSINAFISQVGALGEVLIRADEGSYIAATFTITAAGAAGQPVIIRGCDVNENPLSALIVGNRTEPWTAGSTTGPEVFRHLAGAGNLIWRNLDFKNCGVGCFRFGAAADSIVVEQCKATNVNRFIEDNLSGLEPNATLTNFKVLHCRADGFSRAFARIRSDTHDVEIRDCFGDSQGQDGDNFAVGIGIEGTAHDIQITRTTMRNCIDTRSGNNALYWNADGFSQEEGNFAISYTDCVAKGCTDGGFDLKGQGTLLRCRGMESKKNFRFWGTFTAVDCQSRDPLIRGGTSEQSQISVHANGNADLTDWQVVDLRDDTTVFEVDQATGALSLINTSLQRDPASILVANPNGGAFSLDEKTPPANSVAPALTGTAVAGSLLTVTAGTWDVASTYDYQWCRDGLYIDDATKTTYVLASADVGKVVTCRVFATEIATGYVGEAISNATATVAPLIPNNVTLPSISGVAANGGILTANVGTWEGLPAPTFTYQWEANGTPIGGATAATYAIVAGDIGDTITVVVTGTNSAGSDSAESGATSTISAALASLFVAPVAAGAKNGSSFANAIALTSLGNALPSVAAGGVVNIAAHLGNYALTGSINLAHGGTVGNHITIRGVNAALALSKCQIIGTRTHWVLPADPETVTSVTNWTVGNDIFRLNAGCNHLTFRHIAFTDVGKGFNAALAELDDILLEDIECYNVQEGFFMGHVFDVNNLTARRITATGFSKRIFRFFADSHDWLIEDIHGNAGRQDRDSWSNFIAADDTAHDLILRGTVGGGIYDGIIENCHDSQFGSQTSYWNSDGISTEYNNYNFLIENCTFRGCTDGGVDLKGDHTIIRNCTFVDNGKNIRIWDRMTDFVIDNCVIGDPRIRGGNGGRMNVHVIAGVAAVNNGPTIDVKDTTFENITTNQQAYTWGNDKMWNAIIRDLSNTYINCSSATNPATTLHLVGSSADATPPVITTEAAIDTYKDYKTVILLTANEPVSWRKIGGADAALFSFRHANGVADVKTGSRLWFPKTPYNPGGQNDYVVEVEAKDANNNITTKEITVTVLDEIAPMTFYTTFEGANGSTATVIDLAGGKSIFPQSGAALSTTTPLAGASSMLFTGGNSRALMGDHDDWQMPEEFTFEALIRPTSLPNTGTIISQGTNNTNLRSFWFYVTTGGALGFQYSLNGTIWNDLISSATGLIVPNTTYRVAVDRDESNVVRLYINGVMVASKVMAGALWNSTYTPNIGNSGGSLTGFVGRIDDVKMWKGYAFCGDDAGYTP